MDKYPRDNRSEKEIVELRFSRDIALDKKDNIIVEQFRIAKETIY